MQENLSEFGKSDKFFEPQVVRSQFVPTKRLWALVALGIPLIWLAGFVGFFWFAYFYNLMLLAAALITFYYGPNSRDLRFRRRMDAVLSVRARNRIRIELEHDGDFPLSGEIRDEFPATFTADQPSTKLSIRPGQKFIYDYFLVPPERGEEFFRATFLRLNCPFGLVQKQIRLNTEQDVKVYPNILALREFELLNQRGRLREAGVRKSRMKGMGTEFESLREYSEGDDFRKIDWKATARRGKVIVREYEVERNQAVILCVDCGRHMMAEIDGVRKLDLVLDSVLMLIQSALAAGDNVGLLAYGGDIIRYISPKKGHRQLGVLLNATYNLVAEPVESDPVRAFGYLTGRHKRRSLVINFTAVEDRDQAKDVIQSFGNFTRNHIALLANISDPKFREILRQQPENAEELFRFASAHYLTDERRQAATMLRTANINVLDSEPQDLAGDLVNFYLDIKARGKL
ncbi:MAG: DUF58 domain-containing protein [Armatimonadetes bacterium]|nr:DUF58 domain-containing protein [Armatimonadota bacterium]MBS1727421.1 DUF58 domain-containing protein [Armatimonadota bacterium]